MSGHASTPPRSSRDIIPLYATRGSDVAHWAIASLSVVIALGGHGDVAQLAERYLCKVDVRGSIPLVSTEERLTHPMHDRLAAGSEPAASEADRVTQLAEGSVVVEGFRFGRAGLPDCCERSVKASKLLEEADVGVFVRWWLDVIDELLSLSPTITDPREVAAGNPTRPGDADLRPLEPLPEAPQSRYPAAADPGPMNPKDYRRLNVLFAR